MTETVNIILYKAWILYCVCCSVIKCAFGNVLPAPIKPLVPKIMTTLCVSLVIKWFFNATKHICVNMLTREVGKMRCTWTSVKIPGDDMQWSEGSELEHLQFSIPTGFGACACSHSSLGFCPATSRLWWTIRKQDFWRKSMDEHLRSFLVFSWKKLFGFFSGQNFFVKDYLHFACKTA